MINSLIHQLIIPLVEISLQRRQAQMVKNCASSHKTNYIDIVTEILNPEGHQNCCIDSHFTAILLNWVNVVFLWSCIEKGLRLQPAQQACF